MKFFSYCDRIVNSSELILGDGVGIASKDAVCVASKDAVCVTSEDAVCVASEDVVGVDSNVVTVALRDDVSILFLAIRINDLLSRT